MTQLHYTAEVKHGLLLELPLEASELHLKPGDRVEIRLDLPTPYPQKPEEDPTIALLESWLAQAPTDPDAVREAENDLREFKRNINLSRKEAGGRLHYPEVE